LKTNIQKITSCVNK